MQYENMVPGIFLRRPNRFIAQVNIGQTETVCHVKNTGRCRELLVPGAQVWCQRSQNPNRKTGYDLITVKKGSRLINMDSQAPNIAVREWLLAGGLGLVEQVRPEQKWGESRFDFSFEKDGKRCFLEVKGVTLENEGVCAFPDAPTTRGARHLRELTRLAQEPQSTHTWTLIKACVLGPVSLSLSLSSCVVPQGVHVLPPGPVSDRLLYFNFSFDLLLNQGSA